MTNPISLCVAWHSYAELLYGSGAWLEETSYVRFTGPLYTRARTHDAFMSNFLLSEWVAFSCFPGLQLPYA